MKRYLYTLLVVSIVVSAISCAKIGSPFGGPKDETPPKVLKTKPPVNTVNFEPQKKIVITFDEFIQAENIFQELIISPPLEGHIMAQIQGKNLIVQFPPEAVFDTLTYTIDFGNSIADFNEKNILQGFQYVFSLKEYIDSMNVEGKIVNAFNHQPDKDRMFVMLYRNLNDSAPYLEKPSYISRANEEGNFSIHHIETGQYRLFALKDANLNLIYDLPNEQIAFSDSLVELTAERFKDNIIVYDTSGSMFMQMNDSLAGDTITGDSLAAQQKYFTLYTELFFFVEETINQYMTNYLRPFKEQLLFTFNESLSDSFEIFPINYIPAQANWYLPDINSDRDTLKFWITDTTMLAMDTLMMEICYPMYDSSGLTYNHIDTLRMMIEQERGTRTRRERLRPQKQETEEPLPEVPVLAISTNIKSSGGFDLNKNIVLLSEKPVSEVLPERIQLFRVQDTLEFPVKIKVTRDTNSLYRTTIHYPPESSTMYRMLIPDSTLFDIYGSTNDTIIVRFKTQADDYYGALSIHLNGVTEPVLMQLLDDKEKLLVEKKINEDKSIRFDFLYPKKYMLKIIVDSNGNGQWDTGNYLEHLQPEKVIYYPQILDIRSNWEVDFTWDIETNK